MINDLPRGFLIVEFMESFHLTRSQLHVLFWPSLTAQDLANVDGRLAFAKMTSLMGTIFFLLVVGTVRPGTEAPLTPVCFAFRAQDHSKTRKKHYQTI